ncbi:MAG: ABC transporter substrate-binding protein [Treponema sp.]|nr:ABC transporter substrate-binding protein [Treponema sp.]
MRIVVFCGFSASLWAGPKKDEAPSSAAQSTPTVSGKKVIVADANSTRHINLYVAYEKRLFAKRGLEVKIQQTSSGVAAVIGGEAGIVFNCPIARRQDVSIIAQVKTFCTSVLVVPVDAPYRMPADLNGRQIAGFSTVCRDQTCRVKIVRLKPNVLFLVSPA